MNFGKIKLSRLIIHKISEKKVGDKSSKFELSSKILVLEPKEAGEVIKRLSDAFASDGRSLDMKIKNPRGMGVFSSLYLIDGMSNESFISTTSRLTENLAALQKSSQIKESYVLFAEIRKEDFPLRTSFVIIKAEPHSAMSLVGSSLKLLTDVFLGSNQKLFKIALFDCISDLDKGVSPEDALKCYAFSLFDKDFSFGNKVVQYFSKDFMEFQDDQNHVINTFKWYEQTKDFINRNVNDLEKKAALNNQIINEIILASDIMLQPRKFAITYLGDADLADKYIREIASNFPSSFKKAPKVIKNKIRRRGYKFANITVSGKGNDFIENVKIVSNVSNFKPSDVTSDQTLLIITGKPTVL